MKQFRYMIVSAFVTLGIGVVLVIVALFMPNVGLRNGLFLIAGVFVITFAIVLYTTYKYYKEHKDEIQSEGGLKGVFHMGNTQDAFREKISKEYSDALTQVGDLYDKTDMLSEVGFAKFANKDLEFEVEGKYLIVKDFKGKAGSHFVFEIAATKMTKKPDDYDDVCDYEHTPFIISVGYFDDTPLSDFENENGVIISDFSDVDGKVFELSGDAGYIFQISTVETDEIEKGQIKFLKWTDNEKEIAFKFAVPWGLHDVVVGAVSLKNDVEK